jgi:hypothetical protein
MPCSVNMYFGERFLDGQFKVYMSDGLPVEILDYDCTALKTALGLSFDQFKLTEKELLSTASFNAWLQYAATSQDNDILSVKVFKELFGPQGFADLVAISARVLTNILEQKDASGLNEVISKFGVEETAEQFIKLEQAYEWLKNIHSEFYGKKYLIQVGDQTSGVCIKDKFGNRPNFDLKVEAEGGLFYTSDMPSSAGAWPNPGVNQILNLNIGSETFLFHESDNRIGAFVKIDQYENIQRFGLNWEIDLSQVSDDGFYIKDNSLYLKGEISEVLYELSGKQYVLVELSSAPLLRLTLGADDCQSNLLAQGAQSLLILFGDAESEDKPFKEALKKVFCDNKDGDQAGVPFNRPSFNVLNSNKPTIIPDHFVVPARSNVFVYGPWFFQANPVGGTIVESNKDLCPWKFSNGYDDGYDRMNVFGSWLAYDGPRGLQKQEKGSITVASLPSYNIGHIVGSNAATLTDININIGDSGFTTTYNFQTYTPRFGSPGRQLAELWSRSYKSLSYINKFFKDQKIEIEKLINKNRQGLQKRLGNRLNNKKIHVDTGELDGEDKQLVPSSKSPGFLLMSGYFFRDWNENASGGSDTASGNGADRACSSCKKILYPPPPIGSPSASSDGNVLQNRPFSVLDKGHTWEYVREHTYTRLAISTLDLILSPICNKQIEDVDIPSDPLPRLALYDGGEFASKSDAVGPGDPPRSKPSNVMPPFYINEELVYDLPIHQTYLNAVTSEQMLSSWDNRQNGSTKGFITHLITFGDNFKDFNLTITTEDEDARQSHDKFRYSALRGPLTLQSWGYDTTGKPVPNAVDSAFACEKGNFRDSGLKDKFLSDWLNNPKTWPIGPIDLRWDRERGVWVAPPSNKVVLARLETELSPFGSAQAELLNTQADGVAFYQNYDIWGPEGEDIRRGINTAKIKVYDFLGRNYCKCDVVYAYYDDNKYIILESSSFNPPQCCETTTTTETTNPPTPPPPPPTPPPPPPPSTDCWCGLECLKTITNYKRGAHQALVHKIVGNGDCLYWEDIVPCEGVPTPAPGDLVENNNPLQASGSATVAGLATDAYKANGLHSTTVDLGSVVANIRPDNDITDAQILAMMEAISTIIEIIGEDGRPSDDLEITIYWSFDSSPFTFDFLAEGEVLEFNYIIDVIDSENATLLLEPYGVTISITGTDESPIVANIDETNATLSTGGIFTVIGSGVSFDSVELTEVDTDTSREYDFIHANSNIGVPNDAELEQMVSVSTKQVESDYTVFTWSFNSDTYIQAKNINGITFDYLAEGEYMNLTYKLNYLIGGVQSSRDLIINITGTDDGPAPLGTVISDFSNRYISGGEYYHQDNVSGSLSYQDLDYSDSNPPVEFDGISQLQFASEEAKERITNYPEWPGLAGLAGAVEVKIVDEKEPFDHSDGKAPNHIADTNYTIGIYFNRTNQIDFTFLSIIDEFSFNVNVKAGEDTASIANIAFYGWNDGQTVTHNYSSGDSFINSSTTYIISDQPTNTVPHYIETNDNGVYIHLDDDDTSGNTLLAFFTLDFDRLDRGGQIAYVSDPSTGSIAGFSSSNFPIMKMAYNLSGADLYDTSKYTEDLDLEFPQDEATSNTVMRDNELNNKVNFMVEIPTGNLSSGLMPGTGYLFVHEYKDYSGLTNNKSGDGGLQTITYLWNLEIIPDTP